MDLGTVGAKHADLIAFDNSSLIYLPDFRRDPWHIVQLLPLPLSVPG